MTSVYLMVFSAETHWISSKLLAYIGIEHGRRRRTRSWRLESTQSHCLFSYSRAVSLPCVIQEIGNPLCGHLGHRTGVPPGCVTRDLSPRRRPPHSKGITILPITDAILRRSVTYDLLAIAEAAIRNAD